MKYGFYLHTYFVIRKILCICAYLCNGLHTSYSFHLLQFCENIPNPKLCRLLSSIVKICLNEFVKHKPQMNELKD